MGLAKYTQSYGASKQQLRANTAQPPARGRDITLLERCGQRPSLGHKAFDA